LLESCDVASARAVELEVAAVLDMNLNRQDRATQRSTEAMTIYERLGDASGTARILDARAMASFIEGHIRDGTEALNQVANLFEDSGELTRVITPRSTRGHGLVFLGQAEHGLRDTSAALDMARSLGNREGQCYALWHRSEALSEMGQGDEALAESREALAIAQHIGHRGWTATSYRAIGIAFQCLGQIDDALIAFGSSLAAAEHLDLFACWAHARQASVLVALGRLDDAARALAPAADLGPGLGHHEARLAAVELAAARNDPDTAELAARTAERAERDGAIQGLARLRELAER
jgi:tetratricopeptide (TPR) repeat protein